MSRRGESSEGGARRGGQPRGVCNSLRMPRRLRPPFELGLQGATRSCCQEEPGQLQAHSPLDGGVYSHHS